MNYVKKTLIGKTEKKKQREEQRIRINCHNLKVKIFCKIKRATT